MSVPPITYLTTPEQQHLLFLCLPIKEIPTKPAEEGLLPTLRTMFLGTRSNDANGFDPRPATGVHFAMAFIQVAGQPTIPPPPFPVFQVPPSYKVGKVVVVRHLAVVMAIYDADFGPYIGAFTNDQVFSLGLDQEVLANLDETGFVTDDDPTSAKNILFNNGTYANPDAFVQLLMRYNHADPTAPINAVFPGLTATKILKRSGGYVNGNQLWPYPAGKIDYAPSVAPPPPKPPQS
jgi:hypothetical protein